MRSSICFIMPARLYINQEHQEISPLRFAPVEMTKEGTRGQLYENQEYEEIPRLRFAPVGMTKGGCANDQSPKVARTSSLHFCRRASRGSAPLSAHRLSASLG